MNIRNWRELSEQPVLNPGECQLWLAWLDQEDANAFRNFLSDEECARAERLRSPVGADRFTVARGILRQLLGRYLDCKPESLTFSYGSHGKPALAGEWQSRFSFNLSHSGGLAIFAIANGLEVGVDIEEIHPVSDLDATASVFLAPDELSQFKALPLDGKLDRFFGLWTCKEAVLKALGSGFAEPRETTKDLYFQCEHLTLLNPAQGYRGALACL
jgi:4'-phosphopantetheinyl transferase